MGVTGMVVEFTRNDIIKQFECHLENAHQHYANHNYRDAIEEYFQALPLTKYTTSITLGQIKYNIANCYYFMQDHKLAIKYFDQIIVEYRDEVTGNELITAINRKAVSLGKMGFYYEAIKLLKEMAAMEIGEAKIRSYINLGTLYMQLYKFSDRECLPTALEYLKKALILVDERSKMRKHGILRNIGMIYHEQKKYQKGLEAYYHALELVTDPIQIAKTYSEMAKTYIVLEDFKTAQDLLNKGQEILIRHKDFFGLSYSFMVRGLLFQHKNDIANAQSYLQTAFYGFLEIQAYPEVVETCLLLYRLFINIDRSRAELYYEHYKFYINYVDPLGAE